LAPALYPGMLAVHDGVTLRAAMANDFDFLLIPATKEILRRD
jgi:hypothetical protein